MEKTPRKGKEKHLKEQSVKNVERLTFEKFKKRLKRKEIRYVSELYYRTHSRTETMLDFITHTWTVYENVESPLEPEKNRNKVIKGKIPRAAEDEFAARLYFIQNLSKNEYVYDGVAYDASTANVFIFGKEFYWMPITTFGMAFFRTFGSYGVGYRNGDAEESRHLLQDSLYSELFDQISYAFSRLMHVCENPEEEQPEDAFIPVVDYQAKAVEQYKKKAAAGYADAMCHLGDLYYYGVYVEQNREYAIELYRNAAEKGDLPAMTMLADLYYHGNGGLDLDYHKAASLYRKLACNWQSHRRYVQFQLGKMYMEGNGVKKNEKRAALLFRLTGYYSYEPGEWEYIKCLYYGSGVKQDRKKAMSMKYRISCQHQRELIRMLENDIETLDWDMKYELAMLYINQIHHQSWERNKYSKEEKQLEKKAHLLIYAAANHGSAKAEFEMGFFCHIGPEYGSLDIPKDENKAIEWYTKSAEHGYFDAKWELVLYYRQGGFGMYESAEKIDLEKARYWFKQITNEEKEGKFHVINIGKELGFTNSKTQI